jgi:signal peptidase I
MTAPVDDVVSEDVVAPPAPAKRRKSPHAVLIEWIVVVAIAIGSALLVKAYVVAQFQVEGTSMMSTLHQGDRVLVNRLSYRLHDPNRGDVVVLHRAAGAFSEKDLIKRVIGLPGESVDIRDCFVYIDGKRLEEPYIDPSVGSCTQPGDFPLPAVVPDDTVFVMGDNRSPGGSSDSRVFGPVDEADLLGRAFVVMWPKADWQWL